MQKIKLLVSVMLFIEVVVFSLIFNYTSGYFFYDEADKYLSHFLGSGTFLQKIYDYRVTELGTFRAREFSTFFNYLDAQFILLSAQWGTPHFFSLTHYVCLLVISLIHIFLARKYLSSRLGWISVLLLILFLTSPGPFFGGPYYRTSKILTGVLIMVQIWFLFISRKSTVLTNIKIVLFVMILSLSSILVDEGGFAFTLVFAMYPLVRFLFYREKKMGLISAGYIGGILLAMIYRHYIGQLIIYSVLGIKTSIYLSPNSVFNLENAELTLRLLVGYFNFFFGNLPRLRIGIIILSCLFFMFFLKRKNKGVVDGFLALYGFLGAWFILHIMTLNHGFMYRPEVSLLYYLIPFTMLYLLGVTFAFHKLVMKWPKTTPYLEVGLVLLIGLNLSGIKQHYELMQQEGSMERDYFSVSPKMIQAVQLPTVALEAFSLDKNATASVTIIRQYLH